MSPETKLSLFLGLIFSLPISIISGFYAGLVVARCQRFADLKSQGKRVISEIEFVQEDGLLKFSKRTDASSLDSIARELLYLKHRRAADTLLSLISIINVSIVKASVGQINIDEFNAQYSNWGQLTREIKPNTWPILKLWGGL